MAEHPIIFSSEMVRAILDDGQKSQTRRVIKPQPEWEKKQKNSLEAAGWKWKTKKVGLSAWEEKREFLHQLVQYCPYGQVGDLLWVREGWRCTGGGDLRNIIYRTEGDSSLSFCGIDDGRTGILHVPEAHWQEWDRLVYETSRGCNWRSPIHMFKWAARIWLEITGIRVERLQEINVQGLWAEGMQFGSAATNQGYLQFRKLWDSLHKKRGYSWDKNPWVWVIEFKQVLKDKQ